MREDILSLQSKIQELTVENEQLKQILAMGDTLCMERNLDKLLPLMMKEISSLLDADRSTLFLMDWERRELWTKFAEGLDNDRIRIGIKMGLVGLCIITKKIVNVAYAYDSPYFNREIDERTGFRTESVLCAPVFNQHQEIIGAVEFLNKRSGVFTKEDEDKITQFTDNLKDFDHSRTTDLDRAKETVRAFRDELKCARCALFFLNRGNGEIRSAFADAIEGWDILLNMNLGIAGLVALTAEEIIIPDVYEDSRFDRSIDEQTGYRTQCLLCVPLKTMSGEILGVIEVMNKNNGTFTATDMDHLKSLSSYLSMFLENAILFNEQTTAIPECSGSSGRVHRCQRFDDGRPFITCCRIYRGHRVGIGI